MSYKIFKNLNAGPEDEIEIVFIEESELEKRYLISGYWKKNPNFDKEDFEEYKNDFDDESDVTLDEYLEEFPESEWVEYDYDEYGEEGQEIFINNGDGDFEPCEVDEGFEYELFETYWDGSNHRINVYYSSIHDTGYEEITDEYGPDFLDECEEIGTSRSQNSTRWTDYLYHPIKKIVLKKEVSLWQGEFDSYQFEENEDEINLIFAEFADDETIEKYRPEIFALAGGKNIEVATEQGCEEYHHIKKIIISEDVLELLGEVRHRSGNSGRKYYRYQNDDQDEIIEYVWSAWQGDFCGYQISEMTLEEVKAIDND